MIRVGLFIIACIAFTGCRDAETRRTFLFVHGAWSGGWDYAKVDSLLRADGHLVYRPTLTGVGERVHLSNSRVDLTTHITDIVNVIKFERLNKVVLVGHSYAGIVISGVAEQMPERIDQLIYLDAMVPDDGESAKDVCGELWDALMVANIRDSVMAYPFGNITAPPSDVAQPLKTFTEPLRIANPLVNEIPTAFIVMTKDGKSDPATDKMGLAKARSRGWPIYSIEGGHYSMREQPENLVKELRRIVNEISR